MLACWGRCHIGVQPGWKLGHFVGSHCGNPFSFLLGLRGIVKLVAPDTCSHLIRVGVLLAVARSVVGMDVNM